MSDGLPITEEESAHMHRYIDGIISDYGEIVANGGYTTLALALRLVYCEGAIRATKNLIRESNNDNTEAVGVDSPVTLGDLGSGLAVDAELPELGKIVGDK